MSDILHEVAPFEEFDATLAARCEATATRYGVTYHAGYYICPKCRNGWRKANTAKMCCRPISKCGKRRAKPMRRSRPRIVLDEARVEQLAATGLSYEAIAAEMGCSRKIVSEHYKAAVARGRLTYYSQEYTGPVANRGRMKKVSASIDIQLTIL